MCSQDLLGEASSRLNTALDVPKDSGKIFGGIPILITLGDFHQYPPISSKALWAEGGYDGEGKPQEESPGFKAWRQFDNVVILTEPMRQHGDPAFQALLERQEKDV